MVWIDITGVDLIELIKLTYDMSEPVAASMGDFTTDPLTDEEAKAMINYKAKNDTAVIDMDYVKGRCCKQDIFLKRGRISMPNPWYRHTDAQLQELLNKLGARHIIVPQEHGMACHCKDCEDEEKV